MDVLGEDDSSTRLDRKDGCNFIMLLRIVCNLNFRDYLFQEFVIRHFKIVVDHRLLKL